MQRVRFQPREKNHRKKEVKQDLIQEIIIFNLKIMEIVVKVEKEIKIDHLQNQELFTDINLGRMMRMSQQDLIEKLSSCRNLKEQINNVQYSFETIARMIRILHRVGFNNIESEFFIKKQTIKKIDSQTIRILQAFLDSDFFNLLDKVYLQNVLIQVQSQQDYHVLLQDLNLQIEILDLIIDQFKQQNLPVDQIQDSITQELFVLNDMYDPHGTKQKEISELHEKIYLLSNKYEIIKKNNQFETKMMVPTRDELFESKVMLRPMPKKGSFKDTHDYLDCVYRLLREDAIMPLRKGIQVLYSSQNNILNDKDLNSLVRKAGVRFFKNAKIHNLEVLDFQDSIAVTLRISDKYLPTNWMQTKKLLPGSLIVLSPNDFEENYIAIVRERDGKKMSETASQYKYVDIQIEIIFEEDLQEEEKEPNEDQNLINIFHSVNVPENYRSRLIDFFSKYKSTSMKMIESTAYFEAYSHVLSKIKDMGAWNKVPFQEYFTGQKRNQIPQSTFIREINQSIELQEKLQQSILQVNLDQSQTLALNQCLEKEIAIIQGPPGTGKTFIGEHFTRILLEFKETWRYKGPILVVCYTNHALDQFLMLIKKYTDNFIRIGGRCQVLELSPHQLSNYCRSNNIRLNQGFYRCRDQIEELSDQFDRKKDIEYVKQLKLINTNVSENQVQDLIQQIRLEFQDYLANCLESLDCFEDDEYKTEILDHIISLQKSDQDLSIIFWLEIINLPKLIEYYAEQLLIDPQFFTDNDENMNIDDVDERLLHNDNFFLGFKKREPSLRNKIEYFNTLYMKRCTAEQFQKNNCVEDCITQGNRIKFREIEGYTNLFWLSFEDKWAINNYLMSKAQPERGEDLNSLSYKLKSLFVKKRRYLNERNIKAIESVDIIAMTTTGCAKNADLLRGITFPIIIVEEAAEVFEAHIISSLSKKTEHLVLIGDHQQLRPLPAVYELEVNYNLSMSLFERLIKNNFEYVTLETQRRMRPQISNIMRIIYPKISDDKSVLNYPDVRGVQQNLFFYEHTSEESENKGLTSKQNDYEAQMIAKFVFYLLDQEYNPNQITVLSLYQAQSLHIRKVIKQYSPRSQVPRIKIITVDNFQGEENDIIILSLVRSNASNNIGFLKISNRVCVALSRAKHGMFIFGNANCLVNAQMNDIEHGQLWKKVISYFRGYQLIGQSLKLCCRSHKTLFEIKQPSDFEKINNGICKVQCNQMLLCGHQCTKSCHKYQITENDLDGHKNYKCNQVCQKALPCGHKCSYKCYECNENCKPCFSRVKINFPLCNHINEIRCDERDTAKCMSSCERIFDCGHSCPDYCFIDCSKKVCKSSVEVQLPCGHTIEKDCYQSLEEFQSKQGCYRHCKNILECGHVCPNRCGECFKNQNHGKCPKKCQQIIVNQLHFEEKTTKCHCIEDYMTQQQEQFKNLIKTLSASLTLSYDCNNYLLKYQEKLQQSFKPSVFYNPFQKLSQKFDHFLCFLSIANYISNFKLKERHSSIPESAHNLNTYFEVKQLYAEIINKEEMNEKEIDKLQNFCKFIDNAFVKRTQLMTSFYEKNQEYQCSCQN